MALVLRLSHRLLTLYTRSPAVFNPVVSRPLCIPRFSTLSSIRYTRPMESTDPVAQSEAAVSQPTPISDSAHAPDTAMILDEPAADAEAEPATADAAPETMSKNQLRKLKRREKWESHREDRKAKRREKRVERVQRRKDQYAEAVAAGIDPATVLPAQPRRRPLSKYRVPIAIVVDCDFEAYMREDELISLGGQMVRCYSDNNHAMYRTHLHFSSMPVGCKLRERFDSVLEGQYKQWRETQFMDDDFVAVARLAAQAMAAPDGGEILGALKHASAASADVSAKPADVPAPAAAAADGEPRDPLLDSIVYLSSDSPHTLTRLEPHTTYVIGGLVDKNREKGLCYQRAVGRGVRTAKLPIGDFMALSTRHVLTTNHVVEIMLRWLQTGDWGEAFVSVIPQRKGGKLKSDGDAESIGAVTEIDEDQDPVEVEPSNDYDGDESVEAQVNSEEKPGV